jgi:hypothetical protein
MSSQLTAKSSKTRMIDAKKYMIKPFKKAGAIKYGIGEKPVKGMKKIYYGYDADDNLVAIGSSLILKKTEEVTCVIVLAKDDDAIKIRQLLIPDLRKKIKSSSYSLKLQDSAKKLRNITVFEDKKKVKIDAITGATKYSKTFYKSVESMTDALLKELKKKHKVELKLFK